MLKDDFGNNNSGKAMGDLVDALKDAPLQGQPVDREVDSNGTEIILTKGDNK